MAQSAKKEENKSLDIVKKDVVDVVSTKVRQFQEKGELDLPPNYSPENAMKSAWLKLQETKDKNGKPALEVCTKNSIANALLDMVVQGLNPAKDQCYFIPYGQELVCQRSYFGSMAVAKQMADVKDISASIVYKGDDFKYEIEKGKAKIVSHVQTLESANGEEMIGAYCTLEFEDGREHTEIMTFKEIEQAWKQSKLYKENGNGTHQKFPAEMAKKTVINRACKKYINSSSDSHLLLDAFNRADETRSEHEVQEEISNNANTEPIDIDYTTVEDEENKEPEPKPDGYYETQEVKTDEAGEEIKQKTIEDASEDTTEPASGPDF